MNRKMSNRSFRLNTLECDFAVVGGGLAGTCAAITAARLGLKVYLVQDRPILGGNSSSEIRLWVLGASCYGRSHNRYSRESGVIGELLIENRYRNPEGNPVLWDTILLEWAARESNLSLLLDTVVHSVEMDSQNRNRIHSVEAYTSISQTKWNIHAPYFLDASGDGVVGFLSGAEFRMGRESREEFQESFAPVKEDQCLLGSSIYFMSKDAGYPVQFIAPSYALDLSKTEIPKFRRIRPSENGPEFWWLEYGGLLDTIHDAQKIKWELWRIVYGVWDYIKNSHQYENTENLTLEWVGLLPGKRESRRFVGDYLLNQNDILEQRKFDDAVAVGGWPIDLHPAEGIYSKEHACTQQHPDGVYTIPYRCYYSRNIENLFLGGRIISASHVAFGSTRVMATCAVGGQAVGCAAFLCRCASLKPKELAAPAGIRSLQHLLLRKHQDIHWLKNDDPVNVTPLAKVNASSERIFTGFHRRNGEQILLNDDLALMFPVIESLDCLRIPCDVKENTELYLKIYKNKKSTNYVPDEKLFEQTVQLAKGENQELILEPKLQLKEPAFLWLVIHQNENISFYQSPDKAVGVIAKKPEKPREIHHEYEGALIWKPRKVSLAFSMEPEQYLYKANNVINGYTRPFRQCNCWNSSEIDSKPEWIQLRWDTPQILHEIDVICNSDLDNPLETILTRHENRVLQEILKDVDIQIETTNGEWQTVNQVRENHHAVIRTELKAQAVQAVQIVCHAAQDHYPYAEIFEIRAYTSGRDIYWKNLSNQE